MYYLPVGFRIPHTLHKFISFMYDLIRPPAFLCITLCPTPIQTLKKNTYHPILNYLNLWGKKVPKHTPSKTTLTWTH